jgi:hypothetical protein
LAAESSSDTTTTNFNEAEAPETPRQGGTGLLSTVKKTLKKATSEFLQFLKIFII